VACLLSDGCFSKLALLIIQFKRVDLVQNEHHLTIIIVFSITCSHHDIAEKLFILAFSNNEPPTHSPKILFLTKGQSRDL
jgi:hypothetical protein